MHKTKCSFSSSCVACDKGILIGKDESSFRVPYANLLLLLNSANQRINLTKLFAKMSVSLVFAPVIGNDPLFL
eukprot:jgi/Antlo1/1340/1649